MPILNKIERHLDNVDAMKVNIKEDIETIFNNLNIKNTIEATADTVEVLIFAITEKITKKYIKQVFKESQEYVKNVLAGEKKL